MVQVKALDEPISAVYGQNSWLYLGIVLFLLTRY